MPSLDDVDVCCATCRRCKKDPLCEFGSKAEEWEEERGYDRERWIEFEFCPAYAPEAVQGEPLRPHCFECEACRTNPNGSTCDKSGECIAIPDVHCCPHFCPYETSPLAELANDDAPTLPGLVVEPPAELPQPDVDPRITEKVQKLVEVIDSQLPNIRDAVTAIHATCEEFDEYELNAQAALQCVELTATMGGIGVASIFIGQGVNTLNKLAVHLRQNYLKEKEAANG